MTGKKWVLINIVKDRWRVRVFEDDYHHIYNISIGSSDHGMVCAARQRPVSQPVCLSFLSNAAPPKMCIFFGRIWKSADTNLNIWRVSKGFTTNNTMIKSRTELIGRWTVFLSPCTGVPLELLPLFPPNPMISFLTDSQHNSISILCTFSSFGPFKITVFMSLASSE